MPGRNLALMMHHRCLWCGYVYDPSRGEPARGTSPGTDFDRLPDDWSCPDCRAPKSDFEPVAETDLAP